jgi:hypothetical protein
MAAAGAVLTAVRMVVVVVPGGVGFGEGDGRTSKYTTVTITKATTSAIVDRRIRPKWVCRCMVSRLAGGRSWQAG